MKKSCKHIDITDTKTDYTFVYDCIHRHYKRYNFRSLLIRIGGMSKEEYERLLDGDLSLLADPVEKVTEECVRQIKNRKLELSPCQIRTRMDISTGKIRLIGRESPLQQCLGYIAVGAAKEIWDRRIIPQQASSIKGRGQTYGVSMIAKWVTSDKRASEWAKKHNKTFHRLCKFFVKLDVRKCYQSSRRRTFIRLFKRDCANEDLIWLWSELFKKHQVPLPDKSIYPGFMIGAPPSQWACQYLLSFVYRFVMGLHTERRGKKIKMVSHALIFMDDILLMGSSRKNLKMAVRRLIAYTKEELGLDIKPNWQIAKIEETPIDMMGFRIHEDGGVTVRPRVFIRARRMALRCIRDNFICLRRAERILSYKGYFYSRRPKFKFKNHKIMKKLNLRLLFRRAAHIMRTEAKYEKLLERGTGGNRLYAPA